MVPPVASVVRSTLRSRPKALSGSARSGVTILACSDDLISSLLLLPPADHGRVGRRVPIAPADDARPIVASLSMPILYVHAHPLRRGASAVTRPWCEACGWRTRSCLGLSHSVSRHPTPPATYPPVRPATPPRLGDEGCPFTTMALALRAAERTGVRQGTRQLPAQPT